MMAMYLTLAMVVTTISAVAFAADQPKEMIDTPTLTEAYNICQLPEARVQQVDRQWIWANGFGDCGKVVDYYNSHRAQRASALLGWRQSFVHGTAEKLK